MLASLVLPYNEDVSFQTIAISETKNFSMFWFRDELSSNEFFLRRICSKRSTVEILGFLWIMVCS